MFFKNNGSPAGPRQRPLLVKSRRNGAASAATSSLSTGVASIFRSNGLPLRSSLVRSSLRMQERLVRTSPGLVSHESENVASNRGGRERRKNSTGMIRVLRRILNGFEKRQQIQSHLSGTRVGGRALQHGQRQFAVPGFEPPRHPARRSSSCRLTESPANVQGDSIEHPLIVHFPEAIFHAGTPTLEQVNRFDPKMGSSETIFLAHPHVA